MSGRAAGGISSLLKFPKAIDSPLYSAFLKQLYVDNGKNGKAFAHVTRADIDESYRRLLQRRFPHDENACTRYLDEARSPVGQRLWERFEKDTGLRPVSSAASVEASKLKLPNLGRLKGKRFGTETWEAQNYADFAAYIKRKNPEMSFNKDTVDEAFRVALTQASGKTSEPGLFEKMSARVSL